MSQALSCPVCGKVPPPNVDKCPNDGAPVLTGHERTDTRDPLVGEVLGEYRVEALIGAGGMGLVYRGEQPLIGKRVAIKILKPQFAEDKLQVERFVAEARAVNAIRHRGIVDIFGFGELKDGRQYMVMELLDGKPFDALLRERAPLPVPEVLSYLDEILAALAAAHAAGVVHRDLKPSNVFLVTQADGARYLKVLDFGLAKHQPRHQPHMTPRSGQDFVVGTPEYIAPEQARGADVSPQADLYSLGVIAFEMLTGELPFKGATAMELLLAHLNKPAPVPSSVERAVPPELDALVERLLKKSAAERYSSADDLRREVARIKRRLAQAATQMGSLEGSRPSSIRKKLRPEASATTNPAETIASGTAPIATAMPTVQVTVPDEALQASTEIAISSEARPKLPAAVLFAGAAAVLVAIGLGAFFITRANEETRPGALLALDAGRPATAISKAPVFPVDAGAAAVVEAPKPSPAADAGVALAVAPVPPPKPMLASATAPVRPAVRPQPKSHEPSLSTRIEVLEKRIKKSGRAVDPRAVALLANFKKQARDAKDPKGQRDLGRKLDLFEKQFLGK